MEDSLTSKTGIPIKFQILENFPGLPTEPLPIQNFVSSIPFDYQKNLNITIECKQDIEIKKKYPGLPTEPLHIQKLSNFDFESPSVSKTFPGLPTEPLPIQKLEEFKSPSGFETFPVLPTEPLPIQKLEKC